MRALRQLGRSASASLLLGGRRFSEDAGGEEGDEEHHDASQQTPLDKTLTKIGFGTYQKKLLWVEMLYFPVMYLLLMHSIPSCSLHLEMTLIETRVLCGCELRPDSRATHAES